MNQPQDENHKKSNATKIFEEALGSHLKTQKLICDIEMANSPSVARLANPQGFPEYCECNPDEMKPSNSAHRERKDHSFYERLCLNCDLWISWEHMNNYNRVHGFSGWDEMNDHNDDERIFEND